MAKYLSEPNPVLDAMGCLFFFSSRRRHTRFDCDWSSDVCSSDLMWGRGVKDVPVLAYDRVRFFGERVAAVAAEDEDIAQQALELIQVEYEELPEIGRASCRERV